MMIKRSILLGLVLTWGSILHASVPMRFICTDGRWDYWWTNTDVLGWHEDVDTTPYPDQRVTEPVHEPIVRTESGAGGFLLWYGEGNEVSSVWLEPGDTECNAGSDGLPNYHHYSGTECAGADLVLPQMAGQSFFVDGQEYHINADGTLSWVVPETAIWTWEFYNTTGIVFAVVEQTAPGDCHVTLGG